ncbi:MAG: hypothetical protein HKN75_07755 [Bacteroidia bacterium]|nr:hypothetical protein [Bacteroidia bacterium]
MKATIIKNSDGSINSLTGVMAVVEEGGEINVGDEIKIEFPEETHVPLSMV